MISFDKQVQDGYSDMIENVKVRDHIKLYGRK